MARIITEAHLWTALQMAESATDPDRGIVQTIHKLAESRMKEHIGYDPTQQTYTNEYYPRHQQSIGMPFAGIWDVNAAGTHARLETVAGTLNTLQLRAIPLRSITEIRVDENGRFGQGTAAFASGTEWTAGLDYWAEYEMDGICESGLIHAAGSWPIQQGSVRITYKAGYTQNELNGNLVTAGTDQKDASPLLGGVLKTAMEAFRKFKARKSNFAGLTGPFQSERAQDYSYTLGKNQLDALSFLVQLSPEVIRDVETFVHMGRMRT
jgi:hypothetical protein